METDIGHSAHRKINEYSRIIPEKIKNDTGMYSIQKPRDDSKVKHRLSINKVRDMIAESCIVLSLTRSGI